MHVERVKSVGNRGSCGRFWVASVVSFVVTRHSVAFLHQSDRDRRPGIPCLVTHATALRLSASLHTHTHSRPLADRGAVPRARPARALPGGGRGGGAHDARGGRVCIACHRDRARRRRRRARRRRRGWALAAG
jgi:hypothetical protein